MGEFDMEGEHGCKGRLDGLRTRFEANRENLLVLEQVNAALRPNTSDEAIDLQAEVMLAITALRPARAVPQPTNVKSAVVGILADNGRTSPDGRSLYRYRVSDARFSQLKSEIERLSRGWRRQRLVSSGGPEFVVYCAEWFRREYTGGQYAWKMPYPQLFEPLSNNETRFLTQDGLKWWKLKPKRSDTQELRLQSVILEGGFPTRLLESREHGRIAAHLRSLIVHLESRAAPTEEDAFSASRSSTVNLAQFDHEDFHLLCAELALAIHTLRRQVQELAPPGVAASAWLDAARPDWRDVLPISLSGDGAKRLLDDLVSERIERLKSDAVCRRMLIKSESGWEPAIGVGASGDIALPKHVVDPSVGRIRVFASTGLSNVFAGELALLEPPTEEGDHWLCRPRGGGHRHAPFDFALPVTVVLHSGDSGRTTWIWPKGEPLRSELIAFVDERGDDVLDLPKALTYIGSGSVSTRRKRVYLWTPRDFVAFGKASGEPIAPLWEGPRRLFEITASVYVGPAAGEYYRIEVGAEKETSEQLVLSGVAVRGAEAVDNKVELFAGRPQLSVRTGGRAQSPRAHEVQWRRLPSGPWRDWTVQPPQAGVGLIEVVWRDLTANIRRDRRVIAILPDAASVRARASGPLGVAYDLQDMARWSIELVETGVRSERTGDGIVVSFDAKPLRRICLRLSTEGVAPIEIVARTRLKDGGFARADGALFDAREHVMLDDLRGAVAFADGRDRIYLRTTTGDQAHFDVNDELPLWSLSEDILRLLSAGGDLDHTVTAEMAHADGRKLRVGRYTARVEITGREVSITSEPIPADNSVTRSLEWFSIVRPSIRVIDSRSWSERLFRRGWTLPDDLEGPGLVLLREGRRVIGRPTLFVGRNPQDWQTLGRLQRAALVDAPAARRTAIDDALDILADASPEAAQDRAYLVSLVGVLDGVPAAALNVLERLAANPAAQAALMAAAVDEGVQGRIWNLERELPFMWALIPFEDWGRAFTTQGQELRVALAAARLPAEDIARLVAESLKSRALSLLALEPMLAGPLWASRVLATVDFSGSSLLEAAQDRLRRSADQTTGADNAAANSPEPMLVSCFRAFDCPVRDLMPPSWPFQARQWEGLDAACAAAISAAGRARLGPKLINSIRAARAQEPISFGDLFGAAFLRLANNKLLSC